MWWLFYKGYVYVFCMVDMLLFNYKKWEFIISGIFMEQNQEKNFLEKGY